MAQEPQQRFALLWGRGACGVWLTAYILHNYKTHKKKCRGPWAVRGAGAARSRPVTSSDDLRAHHSVGCCSWVASRPDSAGSGGGSRIEALALPGAGSQPRWELDLRRSLRLRPTSSPPRFQAERPGDHDGGEHYTCTLPGPEPRVTRSIVDSGELASWIY